MIEVWRVAFCGCCHYSSVRMNWRMRELTRWQTQWQIAKLYSLFGSVRDEGVESIRVLASGALTAPTDNHATADRPSTLLPVQSV